jgi:hypothetical protein
MTATEIPIPINPELQKKRGQLHLLAHEHTQLMQAQSAIRARAEEERKRPADLEKLISGEPLPELPDFEKELKPITTRLERVGLAIAELERQIQILGKSRSKETCELIWPEYQKLISEQLEFEARAALKEVEGRALLDKLAAAGVLFSAYLRPMPSTAGNPKHFASTICMRLREAVENNLLRGSETWLDNFDWHGGIRRLLAKAGKPVPEVRKPKRPRRK